MLKQLIRGQWRSQDLVVVEALRGGTWKGMSFPHGKRVWEGGCASLQKIFEFLV